LVIPFAMIVGQVLGHAAAQVALAEWDQPIQALMLDRPDEPLRMRVAVRRPHRCLDDLHAG
jgi:hypothetical protein